MTSKRARPAAGAKAPAYTSSSRSAAGAKAPAYKSSGGSSAAAKAPAYKSTWRWQTAVIAAMLVLAGGWAYSSSFRGVFVLDDVRAIVRNTTFTSFDTALTPPGACTVSGRPMANLSLALNYALAPADVRDVFVANENDSRGGSEASFVRNIWGYHFLNLAIHLVAGLLLFGCVRRTLASERLAPVFGSAAPWLAATIALIWVVHPLQTESVSYLVQRVESLMGVFYLLTLYCAIRARDGRHQRLWSVAAVAACACGMATKEAMVSAPVMVLLWDWMFARRDRPIRWGFIGVLAATWVILLALVLNEHRAPSIDVGPAMVPRYLFTQAAVILHYLRLSIVPSPLVLLYTWPIAPSLGEVALQVVVVAALVVLTIVGVIRRVPLAFAGAWFFLILAPTSSILPIVTEVAAEHRMYLPLAAVVACVVVAVFLAGRRLLTVTFADPTARGRYGRFAASVAVAIVVIAYGATTYARNRDYWSEERLWQDAVAKQPGNQRARLLYGVALMNARRFADAELQFQAAVALSPQDPIALGRLGGSQAAQGKLDDAIANWQKAVTVAPNDIVSHRYLGEAYAQRQDDRQALEHLDKALSAQQDDPTLLVQVATILADSRDMTLRNADRAVALAERAATLTSRSNPRVLDVLSVAQAAAGRYRDAAATANEGLQLARTQGNGPLISELQYRVAAYQARAQ